MNDYKKFGVSVSCQPANGATPEQLLFMQKQRSLIKKVCLDQGFSFKLSVYPTQDVGPYSVPVWVFYCAVKFGGRVIKVYTDRTFKWELFNAFLIENNNFNPLL